ncbi:MAG: hypothetical protein HYS60_00580 [Candidatus Wildermuthbacteria bacterium]|nr:hypothetical protein [Candidatus Wildermuthbacteria bacterium]
MAQDYGLLIKRLKTAVDEENAWSKETVWVTPKLGLVIRRNEWTPSWIENVIKVRGKWYPILADVFSPPRLVFRTQSILINGESRWLELKGYGLRGQTMFFQQHASGDVFYGMYLEHALNEYERLLAAARAGFQVPLPIAVVEIPREEYLRRGLKGFEEVVKARLYLCQGNITDWLVDIAGKHARGLNQSSNIHKVLAHQLVNWIRRHPEGVERGIEIAIDKLSNPRKSRDSFFNNVARSADALLGKKPVGYVIRASKCPMRVGDPTDPTIDTPENREVAVAAGRTFRQLLQMGFLHHCPGTGNWTKAGELTDFQDTFDLTAEKDALTFHMQKVKKEDMAQFVRYLLGPEHTGILCKFFLEGVCGKPASLKKATDEVLCLIQRRTS